MANQADWYVVSLSKGPTVPITGTQVCVGEGLGASKRKDGVEGVWGARETNWDVWGGWSGTGLH
jgi:hypothetical protein